MSEKNNVVYGMINYGNVDISEGAKGSYEYIKNDIQDIKTRYIALGFHLSEFDRNLRISSWLRFGIVYFYGILYRY